MSYPPPAGAAPASDKVTLWGVLGIIGAVCCPILGIVFGVLGLQESKRVGKPPTLAYVALGVSAANILLNIVLAAAGALPYL